MTSPKRRGRWTTLHNARLESGKTYENVVFTGGTEARGVLHINYNLSNVVVRNFLVKPGPQNGITVNCWPGVHVEDLVFENGIVEGQPRMGFECTDRRTDAVYQHVNQHGVRYRPQGSQAISYDGPPLGADCVLGSVLIEGAGRNPAERWGAGFEVNGPSGFYVDGLTIYRCRSHAMNLQGKGVRPDIANYFRNLNLDASLRVGGTEVVNDPASQMVWAKGLIWAKFSGHIKQGGSGGELGYLDGCHDLDFTGVQWVDLRRKPLVTQVNGCSGNVGLP